eukprot:CAMPEP_0197925970 /NCGR_PEP_ID=MMETSP1439-20131203/98389_1 /TAXON_ID=66791 /ORGANISM="Gonyaulax spinifera, Strain CCMP409" /LENGTH=53 /DNA_ID=CAMNT_0043548483 /DNA_START=16 /DNA_END=174 /DNA_ORIENTATION=-
MTTVLASSYGWLLVRRSTSGWLASASSSLRLESGENDPRDFDVHCLDGVRWRA